MTSLQVSVLWRCAGGDLVFPGLSAMAAHQMGRDRQINWLLKRRLIRNDHGRYVITRDGKKILKHQTNGRYNG